MPENFSKKLGEISRVIGEIDGGISYIRNESDYYTIGTKNYNEKVAQYLDKTVKHWDGSEADLKKRKGPNKVGYLWKIPLDENNLL